jgi:hypothetical protein
MLRVLGKADKVKVVGGGGTATMPMLIPAFCVMLPDVPAIVTEATVPMAAALSAVTVNMLVFDVLTGLNDAFTPLGKVFEADRLTLPVNPFCGVTVIVLVLLAPCSILRLLGEVDSVKLGCDWEEELDPGDPPPHPTANAVNSTKLTAPYSLMSDPRRIQLELQHEGTRNANYWSNVAATLCRC